MNLLQNSLREKGRSGIWLLFGSALKALRVRSDPTLSACFARLGLCQQLGVELLAGRQTWTPALNVKIDRTIRAVLRHPCWHRLTRLTPRF
jgi:hypothetical protein